MKLINRLIIITLIANFIIPVGIEHEIGVLFMLEIVSPVELFQAFSKSSFINHYEIVDFISGFVGLIGLISIAWSFFIKKQLNKINAIIIGSMFLLASYVILISDIFTVNDAKIPFFGGLPFFVLVICLLFTSLKYRQSISKTVSHE